MQETFFDNKMHEDLLRVLNEVEDPELRIGLVDVGLIYRAEWTDTGIEVDVTTTVPSCPFATSIRKQIDLILRKHFTETPSILVQLVFDPPWGVDRLSENARQILGWVNPSKAREPFSLRCWNTVGIRKH
jgi:metal-sulfur cluster biosynthetic enzyme